MKQIVIVFTLISLVSCGPGITSPPYNLNQIGYLKSDYKTRSTTLEDTFSLTLHYADSIVTANNVKVKNSYLITDTDTIDLYNKAIKHVALVNDKNTITYERIALDNHLKRVVYKNGEITLYDIDLTSTNLQRVEISSSIVKYNGIYYTFSRKFLEPWDKAVSRILTDIPFENESLRSNVSSYFVFE